MSRGRHAIQRSNRVRLKADVLALLDRVETLPLESIEDEIAEMRVRLKPPTGAAAPIVLTGYTQMDKAGKVRILAKDDSIKTGHVAAAFTGKVRPEPIDLDDPESWSEH